MPKTSPYTIVLSAEEARELHRRARKYTLPYFVVMRAQIILLAAQGVRNDVIASRLNMRREIVSRWRKQFFSQRLAGLEEKPRSGRPRTRPRSTTQRRSLDLVAH